MKELEFKENSWYAWLWRSTYHTYSLPGNICGFFWSLVFACILAIPGWPAHVLNFCLDRKNPDDGVPAGWGFIHVFISIVCYTMWWDKKQPISHYWYLIGFGTMLFFLLCFVAIIAIGFGIAEIIKYFAKKNAYKLYEESKPKTPNPIIEGFKAWKNKYCAKIKWS